MRLIPGTFIARPNAPLVWRVLVPPHCQPKVQGVKLDGVAQGTESEVGFAQLPSQEAMADVHLKFDVPPLRWDGRKKTECAPSFGDVHGVYPHPMHPHRHPPTEGGPIPAKPMDRLFVSTNLGRIQRLLGTPAIMHEPKVCKNTVHHDRERNVHPTGLHQVIGPHPGTQFRDQLAVALSVTEKQPC